MKTQKIIAPINSIEDIALVSKTKCRHVYMSHHEFLDKSKHKLVNEYMDEARKYNVEFFINFKGLIDESEISKVKSLLNFLAKSSINGILVNSFDILELIKLKKQPFKVVIDSGMNIHNLAGIEFVNLFHPIENVNITEEVYLKNIVKIKKYTKYKLSIDADNLPWIAEDIIKSKAVDFIVIKGDFGHSDDLIDGVFLIEKILENPKIYKNQKLPFINNENSLYRTNHFSGEFLSAEGKVFKFAGNIQQFTWNFKRTRNLYRPKPSKLPKINLRLTSMDQMKSLKKFIKNKKLNPIHSIEYGEIISTADLSKCSFNKLNEKMKKDCELYGIKLHLSTPRILIERDFDRVYEYVKLLLIQKPYPDSIVINNIGYWWALVNDSDLDRVSIELGQGLNLLNSASISCLSNQHKVDSIDLSNFTSIENISACVSRIKDQIATRKLTIAGCVRLPSLGLCPLNHDSAILSRLSCAAPCHKGNYAVLDPTIDKSFPIAVDGFCRMHLYRDKLLDLFRHIKTLQDIGINEFVIDCSGLSANLVTVLLNRLLNSLENEDYESDFNFVTDKYGLDALRNDI